MAENRLNWNNECKFVSVYLIQKIDDSMINKFYQLKAVSMGSQSRFSLITSGHLTR